MSRTQPNIQDLFLNQLRRENVGVTIYLVNGVQLRGTIRGFDPFTILLEAPGRPTQMVYKHAVTSVVPLKPVTIPLPDSVNEAAKAHRESDTGTLADETASTETSES